MREAGEGVGVAAVAEPARSLEEVLVGDRDWDLFGRAGGAGGVAYEPGGALSVGEGRGCVVGVWVAGGSEPVAEGWEGEGAEMWSVARYGGEAVGVGVIY